VSTVDFTRTSSSAPPIASVVVPAFNAAEYLNEALLSLRTQTLSDIEIIVVDDGSTDRTGAIAATHAREDSRVRLITRPISSGRPAVARNDGLRAARGHYIAFLDADDVSFPTRLASAVAALELTGALFAFADMQRLYQDTGKLADQSTLSGASFLEAAASYLHPVSGNIYLCDSGFPAFLLTYVAVNTPTVVLDRDLLVRESCWFDETLVRFEDVDMWYRWAEHTRFVFINEVHSIIRKHPDSITASDPIRTRLDGIAVQSAHFKRLRPRLSRVEISAAARHISELQFHVAYSQWRAGHGESARKLYLQSYRTRPTVAALLGIAKTFVPRSMAMPSATEHRREMRDTK